MKKLILFTLLLLVGCNNEYTIKNNPVALDKPAIQKIATDTVMLRIRNFTIIDNKLRFDVDCKMISREPFIMGSSTIVLEKNNLVNPVLTNINPRYTIGGGNGYYQMLATDVGDKISIQIVYLQPPGNIVLNDFERIATVTMDILDNDFSVAWNNEFTYIVNPNYKRAVNMLAASSPLK